VDGLSVRKFCNERNEKPDLKSIEVEIVESIDSFEVVPKKKMDVDDIPVWFS
jgi:hypothetical protein